MTIPLCALPAGLLVLALAGCSQKSAVDPDPTGPNADDSASGGGAAGAESGTGSGSDSGADTGAGSDSGADAGSDSGAGSDSASVADDYYPVVDGSMWVYRHAGGSQPWNEEVTLTATEWNGAPAFETSDTESPGGSRSLSTHMDDGSLVTRVHKDVYEMDVLTSLVDYDPGFARFDRRWVDADVGSSETLSYVRAAVDPAGVPMAEGDRMHTFTVADTGVEVTVPAGTFQDCVEIQRERLRPPTEPALEGDSKRYWFCPGVGKVKELDQTAGKLEELLSCDIPGGGCPE